MQKRNENEIKKTRKFVQAFIFFFPHYVLKKIMWEIGYQNKKKAVFWLRGCTKKYSISLEPIGGELY